MLFPTIEFAVFFAVVFPITWLLNAHNTWKKVFLVAASYYFYAAWRPEFTLLLLVSSVFNYGAALLIDHFKYRAQRLTVLWIAVAANLGLLGYFKYYNFFAASLMNAFDAIGVKVDIGFIEVALPIAISFLTFHALSYIIDVYRRVLKPTTSLIDIMFYIGFFPHLIAGPIVRANKFLAQTVGPRDPANIRLGQSVFLILGGLFKKVIIANYLSTGFVDGVFRDPTANSSLDLIFGMYGYALVIYCDFSAYTDIAIGVANLLGYEFPQNFNYPYRAISVQDFWRRWHMSLSSWLRDYLYIPLGGSKFGTFATYRNIMITMALGGLWHGASWAFLIWGCLHGAALVIERMLGVTGDHADAKRGSVCHRTRLAGDDAVRLPRLGVLPRAFDRRLARLFRDDVQRPKLVHQRDAVRRLHLRARRAVAHPAAAVVRDAGKALRRSAAIGESAGAVRCHLPDLRRGAGRHCAIHLLPVLRTVAMKHANPIEFERPRPAGNLRTAAIVIYATLALLALTIPQSVVNWLADMNGNRVEETALRGAELLRNLSQRVGVATVYQRGRDIFIAISGAEPD